MLCLLVLWRGVQECAGDALTEPMKDVACRSYVVVKVRESEQWRVLSSLG